MKGWNGFILRVDLDKRKYVLQEYDVDFALNFLGGRGFAIKILWDELPIGVDPFSPINKLVLAAGPLTALPVASSGKLVVASKSPLTGGYGDGNLGSNAATHLRRSGIDAIVIEGASKDPIYLYIENGRVEFHNANDLWGLTTFNVEEKLKYIHGSDCGVLSIGPAGENLVKFATIISQEGRSGGRPGIGAIMGSKKLKAIVLRGGKEIPVHDAKRLNELGREASNTLIKSEGYDFWIRQGTMMTVEWCQTNSTLPTYNFREGVFDLAKSVDGYAMEAAKKLRRGCPNCVMTCGNVIEDYENKFSELDYENVTMLSSNIGLGDIKKVGVLNRLCDELGLDTISMGNVLGFIMESSEKYLIREKVDWGDFDHAKSLIMDTAHRRGLGDLMAEGVKRISEKLGGGSEAWAMHVKGLEISAYDCHAAPGMALAYGTSPIGAHHKDAWIISWEVRTGRFDYGEGKVDKLIELQRIRGGMFESLVTCRFPWIELGLDVSWYPKFLEAATGVSMTLNDIFTIADRIYTLISAFWVREYGLNWSRKMDTPPKRWFKEPLTKGPLAGSKLDWDIWNSMLDLYYGKRGWDLNGIPKKSTLKKLQLDFAIKTLENIVKLSE
ncbi:MAG: aldehyde ferredoxin oxidoreductase family protein [Candidatus Methanomethylicia archaeon]